MTDIDDAWSYLALEVGDLDSADRIRCEIRSAIIRLRSVPGIGHCRPELAEGDTRFWRVGRYLVAYREEASAIHVFRVLHESRDIRAILAIEDTGA